MAVEKVRHTHQDGSGRTEVHYGKKGGKTNCGNDTTLHPSHWVNVLSSTNVTCGLAGCKNR